MIFSLDPLPPDLDDTTYPPSVPRLPFAHVWHWYTPQGYLEVYYYNPAIHPRRVVDSITIDRPSRALPELRAWARDTFGPGAVHPRYRSYPTTPVYDLGL